MAKLLHRLAQDPLLGRAVALVEHMDSARTSVLRVLTYHRVDEAAPFARQMEHLAARYRVVSVARVLAAIDGGPALPPRAVLLTFDDAYRSFAAVAWPILRRHGFPAALFVPTAFPDGREPRFWWDRLEQAFARTTRREALATPVGLLPLETAEQRAQAHGLVKRHVKDLPHRQTLERTDELCAALDVPAEPHEVLGWDELRALARQGVTLGAHSRTHPRLDRVARDEARAELLDSLRDLEREVPGQPRVFAYPDGRFDDELVELARAAGVELAFTTRRGTNDVFAADPLRLKRVNIDARDPVPVLRAKLALSAARLEWARRLLEPPSRGERERIRLEREGRRRSRIGLRVLDAALTAGLRPADTCIARLRRVASARSSHYERVGQAVCLALTARPALERRIQRALLDVSRLPARVAQLELAGFGSGTTVFRLERRGARPVALKLYRRTLGRDPAHLAQAARRYRERYRRMRAELGESVLPAEFLVVHAPLRGVPAVACVQPWLEGRVHDLLGLEDEALLALLARTGLEERFAAFARAVLAWHERGFHADLLGRGNLVVVEGREAPLLWLIDYGIFHPTDAPASAAAAAALERLVTRLAGLLERTRSDACLR